MHSAGLKIVSCSNAEDSYWMIQQAIQTDDPVIFFEPKRRYHDRMEVDESATSAPRSLFEAVVAREGTDVTVACYGPMVKTCLQAAEAAALEGRSLEVIDLRGLNPLDTPTLFASVRKTGRLVVVHEASSFMGFGAEIAAQTMNDCFYSLEAPVIRVTGLSIPYPASKLEEVFLPDLDRVLDAVDRSLAY